MKHSIGFDSRCPSTYDNRNSVMMVLMFARGRVQATNKRNANEVQLSVCIQSNLHLTWTFIGVNSTRCIDGLDDLKLLRNSERRTRWRSRDH
jgi:hypothetical protein